MIDVCSDELAEKALKALKVLSNAGYGQMPSFDAFAKGFLAGIVVGDYEGDDVGSLCLFLAEAFDGKVVGGRP